MKAHRIRPSNYIVAQQLTTGANFPSNTIIHPFFADGVAAVFQCHFIGRVLAHLVAIFVAKRVQSSIAILSLTWWRMWTRFVRTGYMLDNNHIHVCQTYQRRTIPRQLRKSQIRAIRSHYKIALITFLHRHTLLTASECYVGWAIFMSSFENSIRQRDEKIYKKDEILKYTWMTSCLGVASWLICNDRCAPQ